MNPCSNREQSHLAQETRVVSYRNLPAKSFPWQSPLRSILGLGLLLAVISACSASNSPEGAVSGFFAALNEGQPSKAVDFVCGDIALPPLPKNFLYNTSIQTIDNDGATARVRVRSEIRLNVGIAIKKTLDFTAVANKDRDRWCVTKDSIKNFLDEFVKIR